MRLFTALAILACLFSGGCEKKSESPPPHYGEAAPAGPGRASEPKASGGLFLDTVEPVLIELSTYALPYWREAAQQDKPSLVLMSLHPLLQPLAPPLKKEAAALLKNGNAEDFIRRGSLYRADPAILPPQTLSAALAAGWFAEIVWVFPFPGDFSQVDPEHFREQIVSAGFLSAKEGASLVWDGVQFSGKVRETPIRIVHPDQLVRLERPFILHVDLGFFEGRYHNEVKTPIYGLILDTAHAISELRWAPLEVTLSYSTIEGAISTDVRFLMTAFAQMMREPALMKQAPSPWKMRAEALRAASFFQEGKAEDIYLESAARHPDDAAAQYDLYLQLLAPQRMAAALDQLDKAVALDPGYAAAYLDLARVAQQENNLPGILELLGRAAPVFPDNPFIDLHRAQYLIQAGQAKKARPLIERLKNLTWSSHFHSEVPGALKELEDAVEQTMP